MYVRKIMIGLGVAMLFCVFGVRGVIQAETEAENTIYCDTPIWYLDPVTNESFVELNVMANLSKPFNAVNLRMSYPVGQMELIGIDEGTVFPQAAGNGTIDNDDGISLLYANFISDFVANFDMGYEQIQPDWLSSELQLATIYLKMNHSMEADSILAHFEDETRTVILGASDSVTTDECKTGASVNNPTLRSIDEVTTLFPTTPPPDQSDPTLNTMEMSYIYCDAPVETVTRTGEPAVAIKIWADIPQSQQINTSSVWIGYDANVYEYVTVEESDLFSHVGLRINLVAPYTPYEDFAPFIEMVESHSGLVKYLVGTYLEDNSKGVWGSKVLLGTAYMKPLVNDVTISPITLLQQSVQDQYNPGTAHYMAWGPGYLPVSVGNCNDEVITLRSGSFRSETMAIASVPTQVGLQSHNAYTAATSLTMLIPFVMSLATGTSILIGKREV